MDSTEKKQEMDPAGKKQEIARKAEGLYAKNPDWVSFYREVLGLGGLVRRMYPSRESLEEFEQTEEYARIQELLVGLRCKGPVAASEDEPTKMITVRIPKSLHDALRVEAHEHCTSMNKLCISKLLQFIDQQRVPDMT
ncbi:MAG: toxin-antitoxin system HicB family antitoxin [Planctomycetes bacterium]|nr:toxin-antitoxin system HicB family antitoxin [Planctomycetota bacterium]